MRNDAFHRLPPGRKFSAFAPHGGGERFARLWGETWVRFPLWLRRRLLRHWRENDPSRSIIFKSPCVELLDLLSHDDNPLGCVSNLGHKIQFRADRFALMPDDVACDLIAHELMHVWQNASGAGASEEHERTTFDIECEADEMMDGFGFDSESIDRWALEKGFIKIVDPSTLAEPERERYRAEAKRSGRGPGLYL